MRKSFYTGKNILPESLKYHLAFYLNIYGTMKISRQIKTQFTQSDFLRKILINVSQLLRSKGSNKTWHELKTEHELHENSYFQWLQLISAIPEGWKFIIKETHESTTNLIIHDHHVIKGSTILTLDKLSSNKIYAIFKINLLTFISKICLMTMILTGQQFICYHAQLHIIPTCNPSNTNS